MYLTESIQYPLNFAQKNPQILNSDLRIFHYSSERGIRTLDTTGMNRVL